MKKLCYILLALCLLFLPACGELPTAPPYDGQTEQTDSATIGEEQDTTPTVDKPPVEEAAPAKEEGSPTELPTASDSPAAKPAAETVVAALTLAEIPAYNGSPYVAVRDNIPGFTQAELVTNAFERYSDLDSLGRCGVAFANIGQELMPTEERGSIGQIKPSGWQTVKYDCVDGKYLYNRCHLIGFQLTAENANPQNLITGTRAMNVQGMLPFENMVADYVKETGNHVLYRVTPLYNGDDLLASGVEMEALSVEDGGDGICFHVFCYNSQPGVSIDFSDGSSQLTEETGAKGDTAANEESTDNSQPQANEGEAVGQEQDYVQNTNSLVFHLPTCSSVEKMKVENRQSIHTSREQLLQQGYSSCGRCNP